MGTLYNDLTWYHLSPLPSGSLSPFSTFFQHKHWFKAHVWCVLHKVLVSDEVTLLRTTLPSVKGTVWRIDNSTGSKSLSEALSFAEKIQLDKLLWSFIIQHNILVNANTIRAVWERAGRQLKVTLKQRSSRLKMYQTNHLEVAMKVATKVSSG